MEEDDVSRDNSNSNNNSNIPPPEAAEEEIEDGRPIATGEGTSVGDAAASAPAVASSAAAAAAAAAAATFRLPVPPSEGVELSERNPPPLTLPGGPSSGVPRSISAPSPRPSPSSFASSSDAAAAAAAAVSSPSMHHQSLLRQQAGASAPPAGVAAGAAAAGTAASSVASSSYASRSSPSFHRHPQNVIARHDLNQHQHHHQHHLHHQHHHHSDRSSPSVLLSRLGGLSVNNGGASAAAAAGGRPAPEREVMEETAADGSSLQFQCCPASSGWSLVERSRELPGGGGVPPSARSLHAAALLNGIMYVFGGYDGAQRVNTFHAFSFAEKRWSPVLPAGNSAPPPSPRDRHVAVAFGNSFYVHGGFDGTARVSDFWAFDFSTMTWREVVALQGRPPSPRHSHAAVVHDHSMYVFGGYDGSYKSDLHEFDFTAARWSSVPAAGRRPRARYRATCVVHKNSMILYGGHDGTRHLSDTHVFDLEHHVWSSLVTEGTPPIPRDSHVSVVHGSSMYVFGGSSGSAMNDLHELQLPTVAAAAAAAQQQQQQQSGGTGGGGGGTTTTANTTTTTTTARWRRVHSGGITTGAAAAAAAAGSVGGGHVSAASGGLSVASTTSTSAAAGGGGAGGGGGVADVPPRHRFCHVAVVYQDAMFVFGGYDGSDRLNDFIRFDFAVYDLSFEVPGSSLLHDLRNLVNDPTLSDVTFIVEDQPVHAHKLMLTRCGYFHALFLGQMRESRQPTVTMEQVRYPIFLSVLEYLYTDSVAIPFDSAMELFEAADLFGIPRLKTMCEKRMLQSITCHNAAQIFHAADMHSATQLRQKAKKYILSHFEDVSKSGSFEEMGRSNIELVFELLQSR